MCALTRKIEGAFHPASESMPWPVIPVNDSSMSSEERIMLTVYPPTLEYGLSLCRDDMQQAIEEHDEEAREQAAGREVAALLKRVSR
jgi:hypothetical protein